MSEPGLHSIKIRVSGLGFVSESIVVISTVDLVQAVDVKGLLGVMVGDRMFDVATNWIDTVTVNPIPKTYSYKYPLPPTDPEPEPKKGFWARVLHYFTHFSH